MAMRTTPGILYATLGSEIVTVYDETQASPKYRNGWRRPSIDGLGILSLTRTLGDEISEQYFNVDDDVVAEFLDCSGGSIIPADVIPDPYPPISFADFDIELRSQARTRSNINLVEKVIGGKPPLTFVLDNPNSVTTTLNGSILITIGTTMSPGVYTMTLTVTDAFSASDTATVTVTILPATP